MVEDAYPNLSSELDASNQGAHVMAEVLENRAPTIPLFHLGVASVLSGWVGMSRGTGGYSFRYHAMNYMGLICSRPHVNEYVAGGGGLPPPPPLPPLFSLAIYIDLKMMKLVEFKNLSKHIKYINYSTPREYHL